MIEGADQGSRRHWEIHGRQHHQHRSADQHGLAHSRCLDDLSGLAADEPLESLALYRDRAFRQRKFHFFATRFFFGDSRFSRVANGQLVSIHEAAIAEEIQGERFTVQVAGLGENGDCSFSVRGDIRLDSAGLIAKRPLDADLIEIGEVIAVFDWDLQWLAGSGQRKRRVGGLDGRV